MRERKGVYENLPRSERAEIITDDAAAMLAKHRDDFSPEVWIGLSLQLAQTQALVAITDQLTRVGKELETLSEIAEVTAPL
jgi:hypothetical protein